MKRGIIKYLNKNYSKEPFDIDRLLISAYLLKNDICIKNNIILKSYIIRETDITEFEALVKFLDELERSNVKLDIEDLIEFFEFVISPEDRVVNGAVYTPLNIRNFIIEKTLSNSIDISSARIADISCGCGGFLYNVARKVKELTNRSFYKIFKEQLFGLDIQEYSITRTKLLLTILAIEQGEDRNEFIFNLYNGDALDFKWDSEVRKFEGFDIIVGNPPYVCSRNISDKSKVHLKKWSVCNSGHPDLYIPFFQIGLTSLKKGGILGYITMNTFFKSLNGRALRDYFKYNEFDFSIIDFGNSQVFKARSTYTCLCFIRKRQSPHLNYFKCESPEVLFKSDIKLKPIKYETLDSIKGWGLNSHDIISKIESTGVPFGQKYKTRNGIATLKNNIYIFTPVSEDARYFYLHNEKIYPIEREICKDIVNPNKLTIVDNLRSLKEKIIFPYEFSEGKVKVFEEIEFKRKFPKAYLYLKSNKDILATRDKGKGNEYDKWFEYGRNQSLEKLKYKLFFPHITPRTPKYVIDTDENLLFYNGISVIGNSMKELKVLKKIMESRLFWFYISMTSKPYGSAYYSLSKNYIRNFGIFDFSKDDEDYLLKEDNQIKLDRFIEHKYGIKLPVH